MKTIWRTIGGLILGGALLLPTAHAASSTGVSPIFTVDLRFVLTGSVFGQVFGSGVALANAQVRVLDTPYAAGSVAGGGFNIINVPPGVGSVVAVAAPGFASKTIANVQVMASSSRDLGVITLSPLGARKVIPLVPDLNPAISKVEEGGVAYRYYRVVSADGKTPAGGVTLQARLAGGAAISQTGDIAENWPGREAGVSDADGIVRLRIPATALGGPGLSATLEVVDSGTVRQTFTARVVAREYEQVWKKKWHGVAGVDLGVVSAGLGFGHETLVTRRFGGQGRAAKKSSGIGVRRCTKQELALESRCMSTASAEAEAARHKVAPPSGSDNRSTLIRTRPIRWITL